MTTISIDLNRAIGDNASVNLGYEFQDTQGESNIDYENNIFRANLIFRF